MQVHFSAYKQLEISFFPESVQIFDTLSSLAHYIQNPKKTGKTLVEALRLQSIVDIWVCREVRC